MASKRTDSTTDAPHIETGLMVPSDTADLLFDASPAALARIARDYEIEKVVTLVEGQGIEGELLGAGPPVEMADPMTGEVRPVATWRVRCKGGAVARIPGGAQLDAELPKMIPVSDLDDAASASAGGPVLRAGVKGPAVVIVRGRQVTTRKGRRVNDYLIGRAR